MKSNKLLPQLGDEGLESGFKEIQKVGCSSVTKKNTL